VAHHAEGKARPCHLEIDQKFFMPTIRGTDLGSKKRYAGLVINGKGEEEVIYRGLEVARSDWTPLAQQFQQAVPAHLQGPPPRGVRVCAQDHVRRLRRLLVYRKRLRQPLEEYKVNRRRRAHGR
jgi:DNA polymerase-2